MFIGFFSTAFLALTVLALGQGAVAAPQTSCGASTTRHPALTSLAIGHSFMAVPDLVHFLVRHPAIRTLDLAFHIAIGSLVPYATVPLLPRISYVCAPPDYLL
ncbi:hypothetical protein B0H17DRAFT_1339156 [Mycena rosella]|uniref:Uncharacterized protein n=1 Tax=Mycena rosella TaxID=1033263 RepID=A0AAD7FTX1_MYCRO|nr:hypothetical protein B0H17DRAFT_1339156 [Mycena rosella]